MKSNIKQGALWVFSRSTYLLKQLYKLWACQQETDMPIDPHVAGTKCMNSICNWIPSDPLITHKTSHCLSTHYDNYLCG
jgi:hypothetical protein